MTSDIDDESLACVDIQISKLIKKVRYEAGLVVGEDS